MPYPKIKISYHDDGSVYFILLHPVVKSWCYFENCILQAMLLLVLELLIALSLLFRYLLESLELAKPLLILVICHLHR